MFQLIRVASRFGYHAGATTQFKFKRIKKRKIENEKQKQPMTILYAQLNTFNW